MRNGGGGSRVRKGKGKGKGKGVRGEEATAMDTAEHPLEGPRDETSVGQL
jgi:hypothetical protein